MLSASLCCLSHLRLLFNSYPGWKHKHHKWGTSIRTQDLKTNSATFPAGSKVLSWNRRTPKEHGSSLWIWSRYGFMKFYQHCGCSVKKNLGVVSLTQNPFPCTHESWHTPENMLQGYITCKKFWAILIIRQKVFKHPKVWTSKLLTAQNICARCLSFLYGENSSRDTRETYFLDRLWYYVPISVKPSVCMKTLFSIPVVSV